jgi:SAM-dependent methyltransferase
MSEPENAVQLLSERAYFSTEAVDSYRRYDLTRTEATVLLKYQPFFAGKDVLDIGIGAGRTTVYLAPLAKSYVGVDFSQPLIEFVNRTMPRARAQLGDMRDLSAFASETFDFVMGSFNVIDYVIHEDRIKTLSEVNRVLRPGGLFVFSSHNRSYEQAGCGPKLEFSKDPTRQLRMAFRWCRRLANHARVKRHRVFNAEYAILNDVAYDFSLLHYHIDHTSQRRQLEQNNFTVLEVYDIAGNSIGPASADTKSPYLMYVVKKPD